MRIAQHLHFPRTRNEIQIITCTTFIYTFTMFSKATENLCLHTERNEDKNLDSDMLTDLQRPTDN